jgi:hypothetical protein
MVPAQAKGGRVVWKRCVGTIGCLLALLLGVPRAASAENASQSIEHLCLKTQSASLEGLAIACYSDRACSYVDAQKGDPLRDYSTESVAVALGREKIEGIITASTQIMKQISGFGYVCTPLP